MAVSLDKYWIEALLLERYPELLKNKGADLDGNGVIEGREVFGDLNRDGIVGEQDFRVYLRRNRAVLAEKIPFFKWGQGLSVDNRVHQQLYLLSDLHPDTQIESAYAFIAHLADDAKRRIGRKKLSPQMESQVYYAAMRGAYILFKAQDDSSLVANIQKRQLDCDTSSFVAMAIGDERGLKLRPVEVPRHVFLRGKDKNGEEFNVDFGRIKSDQSYVKRYKIDPALIAGGVYLKTLDDRQLNGLFLKNRGFVLEELGRYREAVAAFDEAIKIKGNDAIVHNCRGDSLQKLGRYPEALAAFDKAIEINSNDARIHDRRGFTLKKLGRYREALAAFDRAIEINPKSVSPHISRALIFGDLGRYPEALAAFDKATKIDPDNAIARAGRANLLSKIGSIASNVMMGLSIPEILDHLRKRYQ